jgi:hypothetical protein
MRAWWKCQQAFLGRQKFANATNATGVDRLPNASTQSTFRNNCCVRSATKQPLLSALKGRDDGGVYLQDLQERGL